MIDSLLMPIDTCLYIQYYTKMVLCNMKYPIFFHEKQKNVLQGPH